MTNEQIIKGLEIIKLTLSDDCQKHYVDMAINSLKAWNKVREEISKDWYIYPHMAYERGIKDKALKDREIIDKYLKGVEE